MAGRDEWLVGGRVGRPHGLDGSFYVADARPALLPAGATVRVCPAGAEAGAAIPRAAGAVGGPDAGAGAGPGAGVVEAEIVRRAGTDDRPILRLAGFEDRAAAERLRGTELRVPRAVAPTLDDDEWWAEDLEGCRVVDGARDLGRVARLLPLPSCEALEVTGGPEPFLVPLVRDAVRRVDVASRVIDVDVGFLGDTAPAFLREPSPDAPVAAAPASAPDPPPAASAAPPGRPPAGREAR